MFVQYVVWRVGCVCVSKKKSISNFFRQPMAVVEGVTCDKRVQGARRARYRFQKQETTKLKVYEILTVLYYNSSLRLSYGIYYLFLLLVLELPIL